MDGKIPPLILSPFVENSIKHGGLSPADTIDIQIKLHVEEKHLIFEVENWLKDYKDSEENERLNGEGIGLENTIRRLKLLYKDDYKLDINQENQKYKIHLTLPLNE